MKKVGIIIALLVLLAMSLSLVQVWRSGSLRKRALSLKRGDSKADVQRVLGRPTCVFMPVSGTNFAAWLLSVHEETWAYGSSLDLRLAFRGEFPLRMRMFRPDSNDVVVAFAPSGRVSEVSVPGGKQ